MATNGLTFSEMVYLSGVRGVRFTGCTFANTTSTLVSKAINAHNAGITVEEYCPGPFYAMQCDCASPTRSSFTGFGTAIAFYTTGTQYAVSIDRADFSNNGTAIEVDGVNNASVLRSNFNLGGNSGYGLFIQNATGYKIQENNFHAGFPQSFWPGIYVYGSGVVENAVYKNNFTNLQTGIWVDGVNGSSNLTQPGLQFGCNRFANNGTGILVSPGALVRAKQGEFTKGADNDFDNMASGSTGIASSQQFNYFHSNQNNHIPPNWGAQSFYRVPGATANTCASTLCGVYVVLGPLGVPANPSSQYDDLLASYNSLNAQLADMAGNESLDGERTSDAAVGNATSRSSLEASISNISLRMNEISQKAVMDILRDSVLNLGELAGWYAKIPTLS
ncbi:right-handed parallel beta-helix repeat-containing protein, partial [Bacteroidales bacterium OttesenSCG-928-B11]|nr:right-handed parallel beta-helix repeat-containing protein [Bacteroidales bacterium OttesenSCG-928-B11]MDL2326906.1 right-handed parallel beta-helix repeat-containing protein [Bacteroidales bacterium OttesenSCG-928-A14]